jgi:hypothetical protein
LSQPLPAWRQFYGFPQPNGITNIFREGSGARGTFLPLQERPR